MPPWRWQIAFVRAGPRLLEILCSGHCGHTGAQWLQHHDNLRYLTLSVSSWGMAQLGGSGPGFLVRVLSRDDCGVIISKSSFLARLQPGEGNVNTQGLEQRDTSSISLYPCVVCLCQLCSVVASGLPDFCHTGSGSEEMCRMTEPGGS